MANAHGISCDENTRVSLTYKGQFIVSAKRIRSVAKEIYDKINAELSGDNRIRLGGEEDSDDKPVLGYTLERSWGILFKCADMTGIQDRTCVDTRTEDETDRMGMASEKSETFMHASTSVTTSAILRSHVGVVFAILGGVAFLIIVTAIAAHIYLRCGNTLSHHLGDGHHRYGMVEFGGFDAESIEPIKRDSGAFLPGDVVIPDISALTARKIRDTSAELTPPTTPERPRLTAIYHWYRPKEDPIASENTPEISSVEQEILAAAPDPLCVPYRHRLPLEYNKELPFPPNNGSEQDSTYSKRLGSQSVPAESQDPKLISFENLENWKTRVRKELWKGGVAVRRQTALGLSIISAYREEPQDTQQDGEEQDTEMFLWKPLPRPPMERDWNKSAAAMV
ncbi:hypothetical protein Dda_6891 [Drechslerella dactyloides]|uniref:Uncharacterized protein n=1 Tax=Drechslerella dactyloides TaxID=74499 RepID=A0AAD6IYN7_DREDA|nr:hypothetical protein Dda_6891 [Drechslerella dactyloides]